MYINRVAIVKSVMINLLIIQKMNSYHVPYTKVAPLIAGYHKLLIFSGVKCHGKNSMRHKFSYATFFDCQASQALFVAEN